MLVVHAELLCPPRSSVVGGAAPSACNHKGAEGGGCQSRDSPTSSQRTGYTF